MANLGTILALCDPYFTDSTPVGATKSNLAVTLFFGHLASHEGRLSQPSHRLFHEAREGPGCGIVLVPVHGDVAVDRYSDAGMSQARGNDLNRKLSRGLTPVFLRKL